MKLADFAIATGKMERLVEELAALPLNDMWEHVLMSRPHASVKSLRMIVTLAATQRLLDESPAESHLPYSVEQADARAAQCAGSETFDGDPSRVVVGQVSR